MDRERFATWLGSLQGRTGAGESAPPALPGDVRLRGCIDSADEAECVASYLRAWRLMGIPAESIAVVAGRRGVAETLAGAARAEGVRVGEIGVLDVSDVRALAVVGCDRSPVLAGWDDYSQPAHARDRIDDVLRLCAHPRDHVLVTWRGRPEPLFRDLADQ